MKALTWHGSGDVRYEDAPDPKIEEAGDVVLRITRTAICGSDLHLYDGFIPGMKSGDVLGHEFMGVVEEAGPGVQKLKKGDRVIVPFNISCGHCHWCERDMYSLCDESNPNREPTKQAYGQTAGALFGYSHLFGGFAGGQAEYVRVPYADVGPYKVPSQLDDEEVLFLTDIFPTGYQAAAQAEVGPDDVVAIWGCGPVGLFAMKSAKLMGAKQVICIDTVLERRALAEREGADAVIDEKDEGVFQKLMDLTGGMGPNVVIDAVGMEAHGSDTTGSLYDKIKTNLFQETDRANVLRLMLMCARKGARVSIPGVYGGVVDKFPMGAAFGKGLTFTMGQTHTHKWLPKLMKHIEDGDIDTRFLITDRQPLSKGPEMYEEFKNKRNGTVKVVLTP